MQSLLAGWRSTIRKVLNESQEDNREQIKRYKRVLQVGTDTLDTVINPT
jgi:hypothetical protein